MYDLKTVILSLGIFYFRYILDYKDIVFVYAVATPRSRWAEDLNITQDKSDPQIIVLVLGVLCIPFMYVCKVQDTGYIPKTGTVLLKIKNIIFCKTPLLVLSIYL